MNARIQTPDLKTIRENSILGGVQFTLTADSDLGEIFDRYQNRELDDAIYAAEQQWAKYGYFKATPVDYVAFVDVTQQPECLEGYENGVLAGEIDRGYGNKTKVRVKCERTDSVRGRMVMVFRAEISA